MALVTQAFDGADAVQRSRAMIERSRLRMVASGRRITRSMNRLLVSVTGSAATDDTSEALRQRVRLFVLTLPKETPTIFAGASRTGDNTCGVCGNTILLGATEYEVEFQVVTIVLDRRCFALWQTERTRT